MVSEMVRFDSQRAMADYNAAAAKQPNNGWLLYMRSRTHAKLGDLTVCRRNACALPDNCGAVWSGTTPVPTGFDHTDLTASGPVAHTSPLRRMLRSCTLQAALADVKRAVELEPFQAGWLFFMAATKCHIGDHKVRGAADRGNRCLTS